MKEIITEWRRYITEASFVDFTKDQQNQLQNNPQYKKFYESPGETITVPNSVNGKDNINFFNEDGTERAKFNIPGTKNWLVKVPSSTNQSLPQPPASLPPTTNQNTQTNTIQPKTDNKASTIPRSTYFYEDILTPSEHNILSWVRAGYVGVVSPYIGNGFQKNMPIALMSKGKLKILCITNKPIENRQELDIDTISSVLRDSLKYPLKAALYSGVNYKTASAKDGGFIIIDPKPHIVNIANKGSQDLLFNKFKEKYKNTNAQVIYPTEVHGFNGIFFKGIPASSFPMSVEGGENEGVLSLFSGKHLIGQIQKDYSLVFYTIRQARIWQQSATGDPDATFTEKEKSLVTNYLTNIDKTIKSTIAVVTNKARRSIAKLKAMFGSGPSIEYIKK